MADCSTHQHTLCAHHYAVTHFVETMPAHAPEHACDYWPSPREALDYLAASPENALPDSERPDDIEWLIALAEDQAERELDE
jgi:hypothetical protein